MAATDEELARRIKRTREQFGMSQDALAQRVSARGPDFRQQTVYKIEQNQRKVLASELLAIADALGVPPMDLLGIGNDRAPLVSAGSRLEEAQRQLLSSANAYARAMIAYAQAADRSTHLHELDADYARTALTRQTPAWVASSSVEQIEATLKLNEIELAPGFALETMTALRTDYEQFHGGSDG